MKKADAATARRQMRSPNIKTRKRALRVLKTVKKQSK